MNKGIKVNQKMELEGGKCKVIKLRLAPPPRLERGTCGLTVRRSNQLS